MTSKYDDPTYIAARNWQSVEEYMGADELEALLAELGFDEQEARADRFKSQALLLAWRNAFAIRVRCAYRSEVPHGRAGAVVRTLELALELNLGKQNPVRTVPVRLRPGMKHHGRWGCQLYADSNTDPKHPWRMAWRFPHYYCFIHADDTHRELSWTEDFMQSPQEDARLFTVAVPSIGTVWKGFDARYCLWLEGLLAHARRGLVPAFYWPGYDGSPLTATRLFGEYEASYPLPRSPW